MKTLLLAAILLCAGCSSAPQGPAADLIAAARAGETAAIDRLIQAGADPNAKGGVNGWTALMHAVHKNRGDSVVALLNGGADPNRRGDGGSTPLLMAAGYGYFDIVGILLDYGADAHATLANGDTALDLAIGGVADIDRFTLGNCQADTVKLLRARAPELRPRDGESLSRCRE